MQNYEKFLREFEELKLRVRHLFEERITAVYGGGPSSTGEWTPAVDLYEREGGVCLTAEIAGVRREDVQIEIQGETVIVSGARPFSRRGLSPEHYRCLEFAYGTFQRSFVLPYPLDDKGVEAVLRDGVLRVAIPRKKRQGARRIEIERE